MMEVKAKSIDTPIGRLRGPMSPGFAAELAKCNTNEELFELVEHNGFINPDAINEVWARRLGYEYAQWKSKTKHINHH